MVQLILMNVNTKKHIWDSVNKKTFKALVGRVLLGFIGLTLQTQAISRLPLVLVSMVMNLVPLITGVLAYFFLKERLDLIDKICLAVSFIGVTVMVFGGTFNPADGGSIDPIAIVALILNPIVSALITILLRTMKGISSHTAAFYHGLFQATVYGIVMAAAKNADFVNYF